MNSVDREIQVKVFDRRNKLSEKIDFVKYHFEMMKENRLISDLRNKIHQEKLNLHEMSSIESIFFRKKSILYLKMLIEPYNL